MMTEWWNTLTHLNQAFYCSATFFSVFFLWQMLAALLGLAGDETDVDVDSDMDVDAQDGMDDFEADAADDSTATLVAFKLLSIRAIITFCTLFSWGCALYLSRGDSVGRAMGVSTVWGLAGMASVALLLSWLPKLAHTGTRNINTALGTQGTVYLDIPADGAGEVRISVSNVISYTKARSATGKPLKTGTPIVVTRVIDQTSVEVKRSVNTK
jgi:hypothetical protein